MNCVKLLSVLFATLLLSSCAITVVTLENSNICTELTVSGNFSKNTLSKGASGEN